MVRVGLTTDEIDQLVFDLSIANNAYPSPLNYRGFPKAVCTSVNNVICHGIPDDRPLSDGDIINVRSVCILRSVRDTFPFNSTSCLILFFANCISILLQIDVTVYLDGVHGDCSKTFLVGDVDKDGKRLVSTTEECLEVKY